ncbi:hypothetical protein HCJ64_08155 [Listeria marthii]|uniref:hypothetical protein n=1 Tax=Listeria marthii TaxID=529731 RepID=UPI001628129D|nr:hypothetical protein [Listeria marthii]MBC2073820.1 hypothetical protein [Listeria marthii]MBC2076493.1 hypothetical protein [Listeria marthii]MBF2350283.1 hypothetical protein [Listeria marthii]
MKKIQWIVNRAFVSSILLITALFVVPPTFGIADGSKVSFYEYVYGSPLKWLTVMTITDEKNNFTETFFAGNEGISIQWFNLIGSFVLIFIIVSLIFHLAKLLYIRKNA